MVFKSPSNIYTSDKTSWDFEGEIEWKKKNGNDHLKDFDIYKTIMKF